MTILRTISVDISLNDTAVALKALLTGKASAQTIYERVVNLVAACRAGVHGSQIMVRIAHGGVCATNTLTAAGAVSQGDTAVVAGVTFTARTAPLSDVPTQFQASGTNTVAMASLLAAIQRNYKVNALVVSSVSTVTGTITLTARTPGKWAEAQVTTTATGGITATGAALATSTEATLDDAIHATGGYVGLLS